MIKTSSTLFHQGGFALPAVAFLIVIVALIIAGLERINSNQTVSSSMGLQSARAYYAAYSGVEWAAYYIKNNNSCPPDGDIGANINGFLVEIAPGGCTEDLYQEGVIANNVRIYEVRVLATYGGQGQYGNSPDFSSRELTVSMVIEI